MRDQSINTFHKGMQKDLGNTMPQDGFYTHAENIRITTSGAPGETAIVVNVKGNKEVLNLKFEVIQTTYVQGLDGIHRSLEVSLGVLDCEYVGHTFIRDTLIIFSSVRYRNAFENNGISGTYFRGTSTIHAINLNNLSDITLIYENNDLKFKAFNPINAIGRFESSDIQRVYFTDNKNPVRSINIADPNVKDLTIDQLDLNPPVNFGAPRVVKVETIGDLPAGMYQYAYRLKSAEGKTTRFSPLSNFVHIVRGTEYWEYEPDPEAQTEYSSTQPGEETNKSVEIKITNLNIDYDIVELAAVYKTGPNSVDSAYIVEVTDINSSTLFFTHRDNSGAALLPEEITTITNIPSRVKTLAAKDNRLFLSNIGYSVFDLEFNARAYRFKRPDSILYPRLSLQETAGVANTGETYVDYDFDPITQSGSSKYSIQQNQNAINPYNSEVVNPTPANAYKFQINGITLGGQGPNVVYRFIKKLIDGNTLREIPDSAPFVKAGFKNSASDDASINVFNSNGVNGDYKSAITANEMVGYRRNEVYRFGVVLYDLQGNPGFVNWIGDIKFPDYKDYDHESWNSGIRNFTIGQGYSQGSGANYHFNNGEVDAYANIGTESPSGFDESVSSKKVSDKKGYRDTAGDLIALGIQFKIDIPENIQDKISGYKVVRVERTERDQTILGSGILNFMNKTESSSDDIDPVAAFGHSQNEKELATGGLSYADQYDNQLGTPMGYAPLRSQYSKMMSYVFSVDSPEWPFIGYPRYSDEMHVSIDGALVGNKRYGFVSGLKASAAIYPNHVLPSDKDYLNYSFPLTYASKLSRGEKIQIAEIDNLEVVNGVGFPSEQYNYLGIASTISYSGIGEETFLCSIGDQNPETGETTNKEEIYEKGINPREFIDYARTIGGRAKLFATIRKDLKGNQYGGNTQTDRTFNKYISAGPFISMNNSEYVDPDWNTHEVWGGDTYVVMYDIEKMKRHEAGSLGLGTTVSDSDDINVESVSFAFPVESSVNTALRAGWHFANKEDWTDDSETVLNTFDLNPLYSSENKTETFIPKPLNFTEVSDYDNRILYSDAKINNAKQDSWTNFKVENYKDLDGNKGAISTLVNFKDNLYFLQENGFGALAINPTSTVIDESGTSIVLGTGAVIQDFQYISNTAGNTNSDSVVSTEKGIYWIDSNLRKVYAFRANGLESISDVHGMKSWAYNLIINNSVHLSSGHDPVHNEILFSVGDSKTLVFNEHLNKFTSFYIYSADAHITTKNSVLSVSDDVIYKHNQGDYGKFYGTSSGSAATIEFIVNKNPLNAKVFDNIEWIMQNPSGNNLELDNNFNEVSFQISSPSYKTTVSITTIDAEEGVRVINQDTDFDVRENISRMPVPRMSDNSRFRDTYLKVKLTSTGDRDQDKLMLHYVKTLFRISRR